MKKILSFIVITSFVALISVIVIHFNSYSIVHSEREVLSFLQEWYEENGVSIEEPPFILEIISVENSNAVVVTYLHKEEQMGVMVFKKGLNRKLKVENVLDNQPFYSELIETNKGKYALFAGENQQLSIQTIYTDILEKHGPKIIHIPPQRYFTQIEQADTLVKNSIAPIFYYRTLRGALDATYSEYRDMEIMFVDENNQTFLLHALNDDQLNTVLGSFIVGTDGYTIHTMKESDTYSIAGDKSFCFEEKKVNNEEEELTFLHGLIPNKEQVKKVVLEIKLEDEMIYQTASEVKNQQFLLQVQIPEKLIDFEKTKKKFHLYDEDGRYLGTERKL